jgi:RNA polymerase sigma-70 factor, ECF subfamily
MGRHQSVRDAIMSAIPHLRAFAFTMSGSRDRADDLVQETLVRALPHIASFEPGTSMTACLIKILRNAVLSEYWKRRREVEDVDGRRAATLVSRPSQKTSIAFQEMRTALTRLPIDQREAVILVCGSGFSYDQVAAICRCPVGTVKSRVSRARAALARALLTQTAAPGQCRLPDAA